MAVVIQHPSVWQRVAPIFRGFDIPLLLVVALLAATGLVVMYSVAYDMPGRFELFARNMLIAAAVMFLVAQVSPRRFMAAAVPLYVLGVVLLIGVALFGISRNGSQRWLDLGFIVIQPSEIVKLALPLMLAWWFQKREGQLRPLDFVVAVFILLVPAALVLRQPDLGTALLILASGLFVIFFAGLSWKIILPPVLLAVVGIATLIVMGPQWCQPGVDWLVLQDYQRRRVCTLLDPMADPLGQGFHILQSMIAIGSGGVWGRGYMEGTQTHLDFVLERTTDFVFASFAEEFGFLGVLALLLAFLYLVYRGLKVATEGPTLFTRLLAGALVLNIWAHAFVNMGMVSGILPVVGLPLPFLSYGGTAMVTLGASLGMVMAVARSRRLMQTA